MTAVTLPPVVATAAVHGLTRYVTVPEPLVVPEGGLRVTIAADGTEPVEGNDIGGIDVWRADSGQWWMGRTESQPDYEVPVGRVVGTATVTHCLPIYTLWTLTETGYDDIYITDETLFEPGAWTPGRWVLVLSDAAPVTARCPDCWGSGVESWETYPGVAYAQPFACPSCEGAGRLTDYPPTREDEQ